MHRIRITTVSNSDAAEELRRLAMIRRDLYSHSPVEIDPDNPAYSTRRDEEQRAYFEFSTDEVAEVHRVLREHGHEGSVTMTKVAGPTGEPCLRCGHIEGRLTPTVCPNCGLRDISPCSHCHREVSRQEYESISGDLFRCPRCGGHVRLSFNEPLIGADGSYIEPVVRVDEAIHQPV